MRTPSTPIPRKHTNVLKLPKGPFWQSASTGAPVASRASSRMLPISNPWTFPYPFQAARLEPCVRNGQSGSNLPPTLFSILTRSSPSSNRQSTLSPNVAFHGCRRVSLFAACSVSSTQLGAWAAQGDGEGGDCEALESLLHGSCWCCEGDPDDCHASLFGAAVAFGPKVSPARRGARVNSLVIIVEKLWFRQPDAARNDCVLRARHFKVAMGRFSG